MLHPNQFQVNEAWIFFKLNNDPIHTELDGDLDFLALMDAASCFILSSIPVDAKTAQHTQIESRRLLKQVRSHKKQLPKTLFIPTEQQAHSLVAEAERVGINVVRVEEYQLLTFIGEAKESFSERIGGSRKH